MRVVANAVAAASCKDVKFGAESHSVGGHRLRQRGFSLIELVIVVAVVLSVGGMLFVSAMNVVQSVRLSQTVTSYANLLQQARIRAVRDDAYYTVLTTAGARPTAFIDIDHNGVYNASKNTTLVMFATNVVPQPVSSSPQLAGLQSQFLPASGLNSLNTTAQGPTFGPRGLPCIPNGGVCPSLSTPTSYIASFQNSQSTKWAAVTVTPAGRIQVWNYDTDHWSPQN